MKKTKLLKILLTKVMWLRMGGGLRREIGSKSSGLEMGIKGGLGWGWFVFWLFCSIELISNLGHIC